MPVHDVYSEILYTHVIVPTHLPRPLGSYPEDAPVHCDSAFGDWYFMGREAVPRLHGLPAGHCTSHPPEMVPRKIYLYKTGNGSGKCWLSPGVRSRMS